MSDFPELGRLQKVDATFRDGMGDDDMLNDAPTRNPKFKGDAIASIGSTEVREITSLIGDSPSDVRMAKRLLGLKRDWVYASLPELMVMDYLVRKGRSFQFQQSIAGGRNIKGGKVADFTVMAGNGAIAINVHGDYWHGKRAQRDRDFASRVVLTGAIVNGVKIWKYVVVWESDLYKHKERVIEDALVGITVRGLRRR